MGGCFPERGPVRVIWGGSELVPVELAGCVERLEGAFEEIGFSREGRPFRVHMTVGRVREDATRGKLREAISGIEARVAAQEAGGMTLFESRTKPTGPEYAALGRYRFSA